jgi:hypothetical protein
LREEEEDKPTPSYNDRGSEYEENGKNKENHLPLNFMISHIASPPWHLWDSFCADGINNRNKPITGIGLKSIKYPFLFNMLIDCGVPKPKLG